MSLTDGSLTNRWTLASSVYYCFASRSFLVFILMGGAITVLDIESSKLTDMQHTEEFVVDHAVSPKDEKSFWLLTSRQHILSYNLITPLVSSCSDIGTARRHIMYQGMTSCANRLLLYTSDFVISLDKKNCELRSTISGDYKHIAKVASNGHVLIVVELSEQQLDRLLPAKFDGKTTQSFLK